MSKSDLGTSLMSKLFIYVTFEPIMSKEKENNPVPGNI